MSSFMYENKLALTEEIRKRYQMFDGEFAGIEEQCRDIRDPEVDRTPAEILAYQLGWLNLVMGWDRDELQGNDVSMPSKDYKWNQLGPLYQSFYQQYQAYGLTELRQLLADKVQEWLVWIDSLSEEELFQQGKRKWTGDKPNWPMARWIHINSVAPFKTFRGKIRKWKKNQL